MNKTKLHEEIENLLAIINSYPEGLSIDQILKLSDQNLSRRTLQRRLTELVAQGKLVRKGKQRATRYRSPILSAALDKNVKGVKTPRFHIPYSKIGDEIKQYVQQPIQKRKPVGYNRKFLDAYWPNKTSYLSESITKHLRKIGRFPDGKQPAGTYARRIYHRLLIDLSWNSSRLEGNTYSLLETERLIEFGIVAEGKNTFDEQMILNHKAAIEFLVEMASDIGFNQYTILNLHGLLADNLLSNPQACGRLRTIPVGIAKAVYYPLEIPQLIKECFIQLLETATAIKDPFEQAFFVMVHIPYLQPFEDVNKRVSRLSANIPLIKNNYCPLSFIDVPERPYVDGILGVYELNQIELLRDVFVWAYERSVSRYSAMRQSLGEPDLFRLQYRNQVMECVSRVVKMKLSKNEAIAFIKNFSVLNINKEDSMQFITVVETELLNLHEGNIARFRITPQEFKFWQTSWQKEQ